VQPARQVYLGLPDGAIGGDGKLQLYVSQVAADFNPDRIFTLGPSGYDLHPDHIASHYAALGAVSLLRDTDSEVTAWQLSQSHEGEFIGGSYWQKVGAVAMHASQTVSPNIDYWGGTDLYTPLIVKGEYYGIL
jgi:LmbE family N-acetylglucosaminyl deacetylase